VIWLAEEMYLSQWNLILHFKTASGMTHVFEKIKTNNTTRLDQLIVSFSYVLFGRVGTWGCKRYHSQRFRNREKIETCLSRGIHFDSYSWKGKIGKVIHLTLHCIAMGSCGTVALMVLGQFSDICGPMENWPRTIRATVSKLSHGMVKIQ